MLKYKKSIWVATYMANSVVGIVSYWLVNGMEESVTQMSFWFKKIFLYPIEKFES